MKPNRRLLMVALFAGSFMLTTSRVHAQPLPPANPLIDDYNLVNATTSLNGGGPTNAVSTANGTSTNVIAQPSNVPGPNTINLNGPQYLWVNATGASNSAGLGGAGGGQLILTPQGQSAIGFVRYDGTTTSSAPTNPASLLSTTANLSSGPGGALNLVTVPTQPNAPGGTNTAFTFGDVKTGPGGTGGVLIVTYYSVDVGNNAKLDASQATFSLNPGTDYHEVDLPFSSFSAVTFGVSGQGFISPLATTGNAADLTAVSAITVEIDSDGFNVILDPFQVDTPPVGVPEPGSLAFLGFVSLSAAGYRWRQRRNKLAAAQTPATPA